MSGVRAARARRARLCRWRAAGARKKASRQMRDAARRTAPRPAVRAAPRGPCSARHISQNTSIIAWCVSPLRLGLGEVVSSARPACAGAGGAWRARGAGGARASARAPVARRQAGGSRRPALSHCTAATLRSRTRDKVRDAAPHRTLHMLHITLEHFSFIFS